jgi:tight adherence protein B
MLSEIDPLTLFYGLAALAAVLVGEALYLLFHKQSSYRSGVNRRLQLSGREPDREQVLVALRRERGLTAQGSFALPLAAFNRLVTQSGLRFDPVRNGAMVALAGAGLLLLVWLWRDNLAQAALAGFLGITLLPYLVLRSRRKRRQKAFGERFPDAIDIIVRSLRAGHPVPVAIAMVGRELPDPVGTEFGLVADEIAYGSDIETAMRNMMARVGQEDLPLFVTSVSIQASTGGNLSQILDNLSKVIRERFKMRRKIRGLSAEGRAGAMILNITPLAVFLLVNALNPSFYGDIWHAPIAIWGFSGAVGWMAIGNLIMRRMINFEI